MKALEMGYEINQIYEVWHYPETETGLLAGYINTWLKIKTEASLQVRFNMGSYGIPVASTCKLMVRVYWRKGHASAHPVTVWFTHV
jgi:hypothetical protein